MMAEPKRKRIEGPIEVVPPALIRTDGLRRPLRTGSRMVE